MGTGETRVTLWTVGHSTQPVASFVGALRAHEIELLVDVRRFPMSRRLPHFNTGALATALARAGIDYVHREALGGRRAPRKDSRNTAWQNAGFRGYADYMQTAPFEDAAAWLIDEAARERVAIMCAERLWWQCHRGLIADYVKACGHDVIHIMSADRSETHPYTSAARIVNGVLSYEGLLA